MKKLVSILMAAVLLLCAVPVLAEGQTYTVGVCQLVTHDALDAATQGFIDALTEELGDAVTFDVQNAAGDSNTCSTIVNSFVAADVDLILANATAALQAAVAATADIPILGTSVTEYGVALDIDDFTGTVGGNVSGTSDLAPLDQQAAMVQTLFPDAKNVGLLYCSAEANSQYQVDTVKGYLEEMGYTCTLYPFADSNDAAAVTQTAADASDVIYVPTDNTVAANTGIVDNICQPAGVPVIAGEEGICKGCGVATLSISYYDLGVTPVFAVFLKIPAAGRPAAELGENTLSSFLNALPGAISQGLVWGIMAIGLYITYKLLDIADLTVDGSFCTGGAVGVVLITSGCNVWVSLLAAILAGMLAGLVTGLLHTACGIPAILSGILTQLGLWSVNLAIMGMKANQSLNVNKYDLLVSLRYLQDVTKGTRGFWQHPIFVAGLFTLVIIAVLYWFFGTELGCSLRATGANANMARAQGINTNLNKVLGLMISNGLVALSGALLSQYQSFADINMGRGAIVIGLAAVIIGEVIFGKIFRNFALKLLAVAIGSIIYYVVIQAVVSLSGINSNYLKLLSAMIVALFLAVPYWKARYLDRPASKGGANHA